MRETGTLSGAITMPLAEATGMHFLVGGETTTALLLGAGVDNDADSVVVPPPHHPTTATTTAVVVGRTAATRCCACAVAPPLPASRCRGPLVLVPWSYCLPRRAYRVPGTDSHWI